MGRPRLPPRELRQPKCAHLSSRNIRAHTVRDFPARTCGWYHRHAPTTFFYRLPPVPKPHRRYNPTIAGPPLPYKFRERHRATGRPYLQRLPYRAPEYLRHRAKRLHTHRLLRRLATQVSSRTVLHRQELRDLPAATTPTSGPAQRHRA